MIFSSEDIKERYVDSCGFLDLPEKDYYGELECTLKYNQAIGKPFPWLYIDEETSEVQLFFDIFSSKTADKQTKSVYYL